MSNHSADPNKKTDALNRAVRTLEQNILVDALAATGTGVLVLVGQVDPTTKQFWIAAGALALKSFVVSAASYLHRLGSTPATPAP